MRVSFCCPLAHDGEQPSPSIFRLRGAWCAHGWLADVRFGAVRDMVRPNAIAKLHASEGITPGKTATHSRCTVHPNAFVHTESTMWSLLLCPEKLGRSDHRKDFRLVDVIAGPVTQLLAEPLASTFLSQSALSP
jgi:hypothetical protein